MAGEPQSGGMDATQIAERQVIERYLANQLSDAEADAFEAYVESHPEIARQIELVARMKSGLHVLQRRGELRSVLTPPRSWLRHPALLAGTAASIAVAGLLWFRSADMPETPLLARSFAQLRGGDGESLKLGATVLLVRSRSAAHGAEIELPASGAAATAYELALDTGDSTPLRHYSVELLRFTGNQLAPVARLKDAEAAADGSVHVYLKASVLSAGSYFIRLSAAPGEAPLEFSLRVREAGTR